MVSISFYVEWKVFGVPEGKPLVYDLFTHSMWRTIYSLSNQSIINNPWPGNCNTRAEDANKNGAFPFRDQVEQVTAGGGRPWRKIEQGGCHFIPSHFSVTNSDHNAFEKKTENRYTHVNNLLFIRKSGSLLAAGDFISDPDLKSSPEFQKKKTEVPVLRLECVGERLAVKDKGGDRDLLSRLRTMLQDFREFVSVSWLANSRKNNYNSAIVKKRP